MKSDAIYLTGIGRVAEQQIDGISITGNRQSITPGSMEKMRWSAYFSKPCDSFRRMDLPSRYAVAAAEMLDLPQMDPNTFRPDVAVVAGTRFGCFGVDAEFFHSMFRPEGASPMLFTYTLPNVPLGELAIRHAITGQNLLLQAGEESGLLALWEARRLIQRREAAACLVIAVDAVPQGVAGPLKKHLGRQDSEIGHAFAFYMESDTYLSRSQSRVLGEISAADPDPNQEAPADPESILSRLYEYLNGEVSAQTLIIPPPKTLKTNQVLIVEPPVA